MRIVLLLILFGRSSTSSAVEDMVIKNFSDRFSAYTIAPNGDLDDSEKVARINSKVASSKSIIINRVQLACVQYENKSGWAVNSWEANDLGWISGEGEVKASFLCEVRKPIGGCYGPEYSPGCYVYGGKCCVEYCPIY
ncbi:MAG: hypothetical protein H6625_02835 [Bdellovibrionaceae bacterium]|nr:hypothetical protein [Pseudobdellovibrionaceae bacterium]